MAHPARADRLRGGCDRDDRRRVCQAHVSAGSPAVFPCSACWPPAISDLAVASVADNSQAFNGMIVLDELRLGFTLVFLVVSALTLLISMIWVEDENLPAGEFHSLLMFATAGMMLMASAGDLVIVFLGLEILSIATYVMCRISPHRHPIE